MTEIEEKWDGRLRKLELMVATQSQQIRYLVSRQYSLGGLVPGMSKAKISFKETYLESGGIGQGN